ncbi:hypothetical protein [uncultured Algibacter sp.]|nr:hypothetical protein [uncultured Algibacter sp.]
MRTVIKISKRLNSITQENLFPSKRILSLSTNEAIWRGTKRYAH